jgi:hypothetical protein
MSVVVGRWGSEDWIANLASRRRRGIAKKCKDKSFVVFMVWFVSRYIANIGHVEIV